MATDPDRSGRVGVPEQLRELLSRVRVPAQASTPPLQSPGQLHDAVEERHRGPRQDPAMYLGAIANDDAPIALHQRGVTLT